MKNQFLIGLLSLLLGFVSVYAQGHGKIGIRVAGGISSLHDDVYKFSPASAYSLGFIFMEQNKPFFVKYELLVEKKGAWYKQANNAYPLSLTPKNRFNLASMSLYILPVFRFKDGKQSLISGVSLSYFVASVSPRFYEPYGYIRFSHFDAAVVLGYNYAFFKKGFWEMQIEPRLNYSLFNINNHELNSSRWTRNIVAQLGLNFVLNK